MDMHPPMKTVFKTKVYIEKQNKTKTSNTPKKQNNQPTNHNNNNKNPTISP